MWITLARPRARRSFKASEGSLRLGVAGLGVFDDLLGGEGLFAWYSAALIVTDLRVIAGNAGAGDPGLHATVLAAVAGGAG